jgi:hypothetical protein
MVISADHFPAFAGRRKELKMVNLKVGKVSTGNGWMDDLPRFSPSPVKNPNPRLNVAFGKKKSGKEKSF